MENLKKLRDDIQNLEHIHQLHILEILKNQKVSFTENANGVFVNMTTIPKQILEHIQKYLKYVKIQENHLDEIETTKENYKKSFYKDNKDILHN